MPLKPHLPIPRKDDSRTLKLSLIVSTTPVSRCSYTANSPYVPTLEAAVEASEIDPLRGGPTGVSSAASERFWFSGSSLQRRPGRRFSKFSPQELRGGRDPLPEPEKGSEDIGFAEIAAPGLQNRADKRTYR